MFNKHFSFGRAALLAALVLFVSFGFTSCQPKAEYPGYVQFGDVKAYDLKADDPICGEWQGAYGLSLYSNPDFVWATCSSGESLEDAEGADYTVTGYFGPEYYKKGTSSIYAVYNVKDGAVNKNEGVLLFVAQTSPYFTPTAGKWYGVKFQINTADSKKALIEGAAGDAYKNISTLSEAVKKFAYDNTDCFNSDYWNESDSGATKK